MENEHDGEVSRFTPSLKIATDMGRFILMYSNSILFTYSDFPNADHVLHHPDDKDFMVRITLTNKIFNKLLKADYPHFHYPYLILDDNAYEWFIRSEAEEINQTLDKMTNDTPDP